ncbi:unnamed protein product [Acanthosepion pharaonis]|uniref:Uncharacterized protein n=1 Tax=Acanthosepion pharaonis TaxID=158019 RepID=A0A812D6J4_ACAPH|nr:unnamed protein product [Sepia pharaonis]
MWIHKNDILSAMIKEGQLSIMELAKRKRARKMAAAKTLCSDISNEIPAHQVIHLLLDKAAKLHKYEKKSFDIKRISGNKIQQNVPFSLSLPLFYKKRMSFRWSKEKYELLTEREKTLLAETDLEVLTHELHDLRKREILHRRWTKDVYDPLKKNLGGAVDELHWTSVEAMRHQMHKLYLQYVNTKGHAFLDILNPKEYPKYTFSYGVPSKIKGKVGPDPLSYQKNQCFEEDRVILRCETGMKYNDTDLEQIKQNSLPQAPLGRDSTNCNKWQQTPLLNINSTPREASR